MMVDRFAFQSVIVLGAGAMILIAPLEPASAASHEQIKEKCIQQLHPRIMACAAEKGVKGNPEAVREKCGRPLVSQCVRREEERQAAGTPAPAAPRDESSVAPNGAISIQPTFVAPPRTIADITAILDSEKPDSAKIAARKAIADAQPPPGASGIRLAEFYRQRGGERALLGRNKEALADGLQALDIATKSGSDDGLLYRLRQFVGIQYGATGNPKSAIAMFELNARQSEEPGHRGGLMNALYNIVRLLMSVGDVDRAGTYAHRVQQRIEEARGSVSPGWRASYAISGNSWEAQTDGVRGMVFEAHGQYPEAEAAFRRSEAFWRASVKDVPKMHYPPPPEGQLQAADGAMLQVARNEARQGKLAAAEVDARRALLEILKVQGKYSPATPNFILGLAFILVREGRYGEAETLARTALDVQRSLGVPDDAPQAVHILSLLGNILITARNPQGASVVYAQLDKAIAQWPQQQRETFELNNWRIDALYAAGQVEEGIKAAEDLVKRQTERTGAGSFGTAQSRGRLADGLARAGRDGEAIAAFKLAIPVLMAASRDTDEDDPTLVAARGAQLQRIVESYISVLARSQNTSNDVAVETFGLADAVRGHAVQQALADASARMVAKNSALAGLARADQDHAKQIAAELGALNNMLSLPSDQRDDNSIRAMSAEIAKLRDERKTLQQQIKQQFPAYANLIDPKPPTVDDIRASLRPGEALISFYFGQDKSFVWAVPKDGNVAFAEVPETAVQLAASVHRLRQALEPEVILVSDIPPFDVGLAYQLYSALLKPVESGWQTAKNLIVVTNGALGELPLDILPTAPSEVDLEAKPLFAGYRSVPWLARTHAVTVIPSASALITLRELPPGSPSREKLIGFGDPYFNTQEATEAEGEESASATRLASSSEADPGAAAVTRGAPLKLRASPDVEDVDKAELAMLPRLPDTRAELIAVARALGVDPDKSLYLGKAANEQNVETLDLSHYRIVAFATHGLVPGDIDGLTQPALALTAPEVAGVKGDGLLTMDKILALKLDADWVVLSACNTAAGAGAGAEAASGLGSAFFYAGTRALLVTNWAVQSTSARELTTDIFRRQSTDPHLSRGEALQQAMMALMDGPGEVDASGKTLYTYAHPLFWGPFSVIGDGGGN
jgi:CHAT domain-containing protein